MLASECKLLNKTFSLNFVFGPGALRVSLEFSHYADLTKDGFWPRGWPTLPPVAINIAKLSSNWKFQRNLTMLALILITTHPPPPNPGKVPKETLIQLNTLK